MGTEKQKSMWKRNKHPMLGKKHSEDSKQKNRMSHIGKKINRKKGTYAKEKNSMWGKHHTEETKKIIGEKRKRFCKNYPHLVIKSTLGKHWKLSEQTKKRQSIGRKKYIKENGFVNIKNSNTSIEIKIQKFLKELNIEFFTHQYLGIKHNYQVDILIPSMNLVIECDGDYWHKYPIGNDIDYIRTKELIEKGFKVLRLWECDIRKLDINSFQKILKGGKK